jgi:hypothetical protein
MDTDEHVVGAGGGLGDFLQAQDVSSSVRALDDRPHHAPTAAGASRSGIGTGAPLVTRWAMLPKATTSRYRPPATRGRRLPAVTSLR